MKIDPTQLQSITGNYSVSPKKAITQAAVEPPDAAAAPFETGDIERIKKAVKELMAQSAIRPEVVKNRKPEDPAVMPDEETLRKFISGLKVQDE